MSLLVSSFRQNESFAPEKRGLQKYNGWSKIINEAANLFSANRLTLAEVRLRVGDAWSSFAAEMVGRIIEDFNRNTINEKEARARLAMMKDADADRLFNIAFDTTLKIQSEIGAQAMGDDEM